MAKLSKKFQKAVEKIDSQKRYLTSEGCALLKETKIAKFDESADVAIHLNVDPRHAEQNIRGTVAFPHGLGKKVRVAVFAKGPKAKEAEDAGADVVGAEDLADRIQKEGFMDFDKVVASPDMMGVVGKLGPVLGPRGLMPNPKLGTVTLEIGKTVTEIKSGKAQFKVDKTGTVHASFGRVSFAADKLNENLKALMNAVMKAKPNTVKGQYVKKITLSTTMGPGIKLDVKEMMGNSAE